MKVYKLKDTLAIFWFFIIAMLQYKRYYKTVLFLLVIGMFADLVISVSDIGDKDVNNIFY